MAKKLVRQCSWCRKIFCDGKWRVDAEVDWNGVEITHTICPVCLRKVKKEKTDEIQ